MTAGAPTRPLRVWALILWPPSGYQSWSVPDRGGRAAIIDCMGDSLQHELVGPTAPIFVLGSMRSGSTMLRLILDSHENIAIGPETGFMGAVAATKAIPGWTYGKDWYRRLDWTEAELDERLRLVYSGMFQRYAASQGARRWGDKTPFHTGHAAAMAQVFPDAVFVGIVRHPGAVAVSLGKKFHYAFEDALSF